MADAPWPLNLLARLWRRKPEPVAVEVERDPPPSWLPPTAAGSNPIHDALDAFALPWREPRAAVEQRVGRQPHPHHQAWEILVLETPEPMRAALSLWTADVSERFSPVMPITSFDGVFWSTADAHANIQQAHDALARYLGPAAIGQQWGRLTCEWRSGAACVVLIAQPPEWRPAHIVIEAHDVEPRLATACSIHVRTGFRPPLSAQDVGWLDCFQAIDLGTPIRAVAMDRIATLPPSETELEYVREPAAYLSRVHGRLGHPGHREALILCTDQLFIVPAAQITGFGVDRLVPAKGSGGSSLYLNCRSASPGMAAHAIRITDAQDPDGLNEVANRLGAFFGVPVDIGPYEYDA